MSSYSKVIRGCRASRRGTALVLSGWILLLLAILSAFVINIAYIELSTTQLHVASDAAARAAGRTFVVTGSKQQAIEAAKQFGQLNRVANEPLQIGEDDVIFGRSVRKDFSSRYDFSPDIDANAVQVTVRKGKNSAGGPLEMPIPWFLSATDISLERSSISTQVDIDIALVVDRSGSMAYAADEKAAFPPFPKSAPPAWGFGQSAPANSRWRDLETAVNTFAKELSNSPINTRLAIVSYSDAAALDRSLTVDVIDAPKTLAKYTDNFHSGATNIGAGLQAGGGALKKGAPGSREGAIKVIVLMTDGIRTAGPDPVPIAQTLSTDGALIFTITFSGEADKPTMEAVSEKGNGRSFHAESVASLEDAFVEIVKHLPTLLTL